MSLAKRAIDVTITLASGQFGESVGDVVKLSGYRVVYHGESLGGNTQGRATVAIYGLPLAMMNRLTTIGQIAGEIRAKNLIQVDAGDEGSTLKTIYIGNIWTAYAKFDDAPDVPLIIEGLIGSAIAVKPVTPSSYVGTIDAAKCMNDFANEANLGFQNNGVSVQLYNPYFKGSTLNKIKECAQAARINYHIDNNTTLVIWPARGNRTGPIPVINPQNGMIGYPVFGSQYISVRTLFRADINLGTRFKIEGSENIKANGEWVATGVTYQLAAQMPDSPWYTDILAMIAI